MSKNIFIGSDNEAKRIKAAYIGDGNAARRITRGYVGVNGTAKSFVGADYSVLFTSSDVSDHAAPVSVTLNGVAPSFTSGCLTTATLTGSYLRICPGTLQHVSVYALHSANGDNGIYGNKHLASVSPGSSFAMSLSRDSNVYILRQDTPPSTLMKYYYVLVAPCEDIAVTNLAYSDDIRQFIRQSGDEGENPTRKTYSSVISTLMSAPAASRRTYRLQPRFIADLYSKQMSHIATSELYTNTERTSPLNDIYKHTKALYRVYNKNSVIPYDYKYDLVYRDFYPWAKSTYPYDVQLRLSFHPGYEYRLEGDVKIPLTSKRPLVETCPLCSASYFPNMGYADAYLSGNVAQTTMSTGNEDGIGYDLWYIILGGF